MTKLQITLTDQEAMVLNYGASSLGYSLTKFVKFLLGQKAVEWSEKIPTYKMSAKTEKIVEKARADYKAGKTYSVSSIKELDKIIKSDED